MTLCCYSFFAVINLPLSLFFFVHAVMISEEEEEEEKESACVLEFLWICERHFPPFSR